VELIVGEGRFVEPKVISVTASDGPAHILTADSIIICTGSRARIVGEIPGLHESNPHTHIELLNIRNVPSHLIILGGGYVGLEFAQVFRRSGVSDRKLVSLSETAVC
jgi:pyruvate/2-oxoglutarate dehydrogenase complex dihydrolipoamide dehydrogenase (E3) component